ncbi:chaperonin 10-like protein [Lipomyces starkeyi]|uniref:Enoyl reductase (ER) domain-containing protein n=1 Tax=Lipomyces starkeyi NRRL Y-11557 TaxID=675824 RepID=A0A1E3PWK3_LIPST|nr:hypothetical protein LIPSTDRAFT_107882 [Lipomyces starkeyi NRRL Y-11557]
MPTKVKCLASLEAGKRDLRPDDIEIKILHCGICHSDIHHVRNNWGPDGYGYLVVPGHEIVGKVFRVGAEVSKFNVGDSVGVGCMVDSCKTCAACKNDREQYCDSAMFTYGSLDRRDGSRSYGGYTETIVVTEKFVFSILESLDLAGAAPLLCAGITTYSRLRRWGSRPGSNPGSKVGVVGLGGLGHMALKLVKAIGADVTLYSRSQGKAEDAKRLGADQFLISRDPEQMETAAGQFDLIFDTIPYNHDPTVNSAPLVLRSQNLAGSLIGGIKETQEMLDFCGQHKIMSDINVIDARDLHSAYERLVKGDVMQRFVIDITTL